MKERDLPKNFFINGTNCGMKGSEDLAIFYSSVPSICAAQFTQNVFPSASVIVSKRKVNNRICAIIVNSSCANAYTGEVGIDDAEEICRYLGEKMNIPPSKILIASTGKIGNRLDIEKIKLGIDELVPKLLNKESDIQKAVRGITTTDKKLKISSTKFKLNREVVSIWGCAKGAGMISPNLSTFLSFILADVKITKDLLGRALKEVSESTFNAISVDGESSPSDSVFLLSNLCSDNEMITREGWMYKKFRDALFYVSDELARMVVEDGEGSTKFVEIEVANAPKRSIAKEIANNVGNSLLVKTFIYGENPNFGRIVVACGNVRYNPKKVVITVNGKKIFMNNKLFQPDVDLLKRKHIKIKIDLNDGKEKFKLYTCDLTEEYIKINAHYFT